MGHWESSASKYQGIKSLIDQATAWERRSGATFGEDKTAIIHSTRKPRETDNGPFTVKWAQVVPKNAKTLGVVMDTQLRFKQHIVNAAPQGLEAAMALKRLTSISPATARQLFVATVSPVVDYASNRKQKQTPPLLGRDLPNKNLTKFDAINVGYALDNMFVDRDGNILVAAFPDSIKFFAANNDPYHKDTPTTALKLVERPDGAYGITKSIEDRLAEVLPGATTVLHDATTGRLFFSSKPPQEP
ncbi:Uu.00g130380.m01.CDS01 [Anthostomella pinea]|uniref:Uu.00g130380.m01.CDS01 n=1 Tax=Anthostomella pinea TaxID=933095 RepID=A0AAI8VIM9_9PEZI|nr:Uu.00g130380.m01.CDS01 [Anthostomella pinea]